MNGCLKIFKSFESVEGSEVILEVSPSRIEENLNKVDEPIKFGLMVDYFMDISKLILCGTLGTFKLEAIE